MQDNVTPLHFAAQEGHEAVAGALLGARADVNAKNQVSGTPPGGWGAAEGACVRCRATIPPSIGPSTRTVPASRRCSGGTAAPSEGRVRGRGPGRVLSACVWCRERREWESLGALESRGAELGYARTHTPSIVRLGVRGGLRAGKSITSVECALDRVRRMSNRMMMMMVVV